MTRGRHARPTRGLGMADEPALPNSAARWRFTRALPRQAPPPGGGAPAAEQGAAAAGDSITVATWPIVSRVTGVAKFACIGAVLRFAAMAGTRAVAAAHAALMAGPAWLTATAIGHWLGQGRSGSRYRTCRTGCP